MEEVEKDESKEDVIQFLLGQVETLIKVNGGQEKEIKRLNDVVDMYKRMMLAK